MYLSGFAIVFLFVIWLVEGLLEKYHAFEPAPSKNEPKVEEHADEPPHDAGATAHQKID